MTLALPQSAPRHRLASLQGGRTYVSVHPPTDYRPTSHRRSRSRLLQLSVWNLAQVHGPVRPSLWRRVRRWLFEAFVTVCGTEEERR